MKKLDLITVVGGLARPLSYRRKNDLLWKTHSELTTLVHLQSSRWGGGKYVNFGITPNTMITKAVPPSVEYWPMQERGESFDSPFRGQFERLVMDDEDTMPPEEMIDAFRWLLAWIEEHLADAAVVGKAILEKDPTSGIAQMGPIPTEGIMADWARGELKEPSYYFKGPYSGSYYR